MHSAIKFRVLGPVKALQRGVWEDIRSAKGRAVLSTLLARRNQLVTVEKIAESCWEDPPATAACLIRRQVMKLRRDLVGDSIKTMPGGYMMELGDSCVDCAVFEGHVRSGVSKLSRDLLCEGGQELHHALTLWNGPAFMDAPQTPLICAERDRMNELRALGAVYWSRSLIATGRHCEAIPSLAGLIMEYPLHEGLREQWMAALYLSGQRAKSTSEFHDLRERLISEIGMEPRLTTKQLHMAMISDDCTEVRRIALDSGRASS
ncbi:AfsR/SARP family transcriptional regulator [Planomonospora alba]|uniref:AfsR/SARP family transcriptional regulator n=1 Tax=Planomonospora alba TaxID=161354 RepID=UPI003CD08FD5